MDKFPKLDISQAEVSLVLSRLRNLTKKNYASFLNSGEIYPIITMLRKLVDSSSLNLDQGYKLTLGIQLKIFLDYLETGEADLDQYDPYEKLKIEILYIISKLDLDIDINDIKERKKGNRPNRIRKEQFP